MNSRYLQALKCVKPDRVPFLPAIYEHKGWFTGKTPSEICRDPNLLVAALRAEYETVKPDALTIGVDVYNVEAEAIGCEVTYYEGDDTSVPAINPQAAVFHEGDNVSSLKVPDPAKDGRMPMFINAARTVAQTLGKEIPLRGAVSGPFSLAAHLAGPQKLLLFSMMQPSIVKDLLGFAAEAIKRYGNAFIDAGCGVVMFDSYASPALFPPDMYREFVLGPTRGIIEHFHHRGIDDVPLIIGGDTTTLVDAYLETGANNILCDAKANPREFLKKCSQQNRAYRRNLDAAFILDAPPGEIRKCALENLEQADGYAGFILGTGVLQYGTPLAHIVAVRESIEEFSQQSGR
jgi:uroporphyrinogen decarboxylase